MRGVAAMGGGLLRGRAVTRVGTRTGRGVGVLQTAAGCFPGRRSSGSPASAPFPSLGSSLSALCSKKKRGRSWGRSWGRRAGIKPKPGSSPIGRFLRRPTAHSGLCLRPPTPPHPSASREERDLEVPRPPRNGGGRTPALAPLVTRRCYCLHPLRGTHWRGPLLTT